MLNDSECDWIHCDVMDGSFVPNISFGFPILKAIQKAAKKPLDVHLMINHADQYVEEFKNAGAEILTVHYENNLHLHRVCNLIRSHGMKVGVALNPGTPVNVLEDVLSEVDLVLVMSVNPGFGGQSFIDNTFAKIIRLVDMRRSGGHNFYIEVDGGVNKNNASRLFEAGADVLVAGSAVFKAESPTAMISTIKNALAK
ncbi:UNVERIFIED_CONTAM: hypothetical protein GTU68_029114 [Idotea baltica]|nr:hypothetical protein [Idotea baltica]